jgi:MFS family permease
MSDAQIASGDHYAVLRIRDFRLYLIGRLAAVFGQQMLTVAVGWQLYKRTGSALALGLVGLTEMIAMVLCTLPAGHLADNVNRKRIILAALSVSIIASLGLAVIAWMHAPVSWIYACLFIAATARTFLWPASSAFLTSLVPRELFPRAVTWNSGAFQLSSVTGYAAGGGLIWLLYKYTDNPDHSAACVYALNAVTALTCFTLVKCIHRTHTVSNPEPMTLKSLVTGFKFVFSTRIILGIITLDMFAVFLGGATILLPVYAEDILHAGPAGLGILYAALPIGAVVCALFLAHRPPMEKAGRALLWGVAAFGVATIAFGLSKWFWFSFAMLALCGAVDNVSVVVRHTLVQLLTPDEKRGRVSAVNSLFIGTSNELGGFESGFVAYLFGPAIGLTKVAGATISVVSGGVGTILVVAVVALAWPEIRKYGRLGGDAADGAPKPD